MLRPRKQKDILCPEKKRGMPEKHQGDLKESPLTNLKNFNIRKNNGKEL